MNLWRKFQRLRKTQKFRNSAYKAALGFIGLQIAFQLYYINKIPNYGKDSLEG